MSDLVVIPDGLENIRDVLERHYGPQIDTAYEQALQHCAEYGHRMRRNKCMNCGERDDDD